MTAASPFDSKAVPAFDTLVDVCMGRPQAVAVFRCSRHTSPGFKPSSTAMLWASPRRHFKRGFSSLSASTAMTMFGL